MNLKPISKESEEKLLRTVSSAIGYHNGGMGASESLAKAASNEGLNMDFTSRAVQIFNTAKSIHHIRTNEGEKRASSFDKADIASVLSAMLTNAPTEVRPNVKAAGVRVVESELEDFASLDRNDLAPLTKVAYEKPLEELKEYRLKIDRIVGEKKREVARIKSAAFELTEKQNSTFHKLIGSFSVSGAYAYSQFRKEATDRYGDCVDPLLKAMDCRVGRQGLTSKDYMAAKKAFDQFDTLLSTINAVGDKEKELAKAEGELGDMQKKVAALREPPKKEEAEPEAFAFFKEAAPGADTGYFNKFMDDFLGTLPSAGAKVKDTGFGDKIRAVESQAELAKLIGTDTVLNRYEPTEVQSMYNEIVRTTPNLATKPMALRAQLRKAMESAANPLGGANLDPFELGQMTEVSRNLQDTEPRGFGDA